MGRAGPGRVESFENVMNRAEKFEKLMGPGTAGPTRPKSAAHLRQPMASPEIFSTVVFRARGVDLLKAVATVAAHVRGLSFRGGLGAMVDGMYMKQTWVVSCPLIKQIGWHMTSGPGGGGRGCLHAGVHTHRGRIYCPRKTLKGGSLRQPDMP